MNKISVNMMTKSEPFAVYGLLALAPFVDELLVVDTGSSAEFTDPLYEASKIYPNIKIEIKQIEDAHSWVQADLEKTTNFNSAKALGDVRRDLQKKSIGDWIVILDGDEVWPSELCQILPEIVNNFPSNKHALFLPFIDFVFDIYSVRHYHHMGRIFRSSTVEVLNDYPVEFHAIKGTNKSLEVFSPESWVLKHDDRIAVRHFESLVKPHRKSQVKIRDFYGQLPQVFSDFPQFKEGVKKWIP